MVQYGGNTACTEISIDKQRLIFDGGTGLKVLGDAIELSQATSPASPIAEKLPGSSDSPSAHLFFTHARWDRIQGFPFFKPAFDPDCKLDVYGTSAANGASIKQCLSTQMLHPSCPIPFHAVKAQLGFHNIVGGQILTLGDLQISTLTTNPVTGGIAYRIQHQHRSVVYATDVDYAAMAAVLAQWSCQADLLICNSVGAPDTPHLSDGLPSWQAAVALGKAAQAKQVLLTCFGPDQTDQQLNTITEKLKTMMPQAQLAQEGTQICL